MVKCLGMYHSAYLAHHSTWVGRLVASPTVPDFTLFHSTNCTPHPTYRCPSSVGLRPPASPEGSFWWIPFNRPGLLSNLGREDDILPYGGWDVSAGTIQRSAFHNQTYRHPSSVTTFSRDSFPRGEAGKGASKRPCFHRKNVTGWARAPAGLVPP